MNNSSEERGLFRWVMRHVNAPYAYQLYFLLFALEVILLVPLDPIVAFFAMSRKEDAYRFAFLATIGSVVGAFLGYALGGFLWESVGKKIVLWIVSQASLDAFILQYKTHYAATLFFGALIPFPFKLLTISAGLCKVPLAPFALYIGTARCIRFFVISYVSTEWGNVVKAFVKQYSRHILLLLAIKIILILLCYIVFFR
jgi:membrane protein YqaA with SNARE-associated domain